MKRYSRSNDVRTSISPFDNHVLMTYTLIYQFVRFAEPLAPLSSTQRILPLLRNKVNFELISMFLLRFSPMGLGPQLTLRTHFDSI